MDFAFNLKNLQIAPLPPAGGTEDEFLGKNTVRVSQEEALQLDSANVADRKRIAANILSKRMMNGTDISAEAVRLVRQNMAPASNPVVNFATTAEAEEVDAPTVAVDVKPMQTLSAMKIARLSHDKLREYAGAIGVEFDKDDSFDELKTKVLEFQKNK